MDMRVEHQPIAGVEPPGQAVRLDVGLASRLPEKEVAIVGFVDAALVGDVHARESLARRHLLAERPPGAVDQKIGVMHGVPVARDESPSRECNAWS